MSDGKNGEKWSSFLLRFSLHSLKWSLIALAITLVGQKSYHRAYENTQEVLDFDHAAKEYHRLLEIFQNISLEVGVDLSEEIYRLTAIDVSRDELYQEINEKLLEVKTKGELRELVLSYIKKYIQEKNPNIEADKIVLVDTRILYKNKELELDGDATEVLIGLLENINRMSSISEETEQEWIEEVSRQVLISELYEIEDVSNKSLSLQLRKNEIEGFTPNY